MVVNVVKSSKIIGGLASTLQDTRVQKTAENTVSEVVTESKSKLQLPSTRSAIEYFTSGNKKPSALRKVAPKLSLHEIFQMRVQELTTLAERRKNDTLSEYDIRGFALLDDSEYKRIKELLYIEGRGNHQIFSRRFNELLKLEPEKYNMFLQMMKVKGRKGEQLFDDYSSLEFVKNITAEQFEIAKKFFYIPGRKDKQFALYEIENFLKRTPAQIERLRKLAYIPNRKNMQLSIYQIRDVDLNLNDHNFNNLLTLLSLNAEHKSPIVPREINDIISNDKIVNRYKKLFYIKARGEDQIGYHYIKHFAKKLSDEKFKILEQLLYVKKFQDDQLSPSEIEEILKKDSKKLKQIINYVKDKNLVINTENFRRLIECKNSDIIASLIKSCPDRNPKDIIRICSDFSEKEIANIKPFFINTSKYDITNEGFAVRIINKQNHSSLIMFNEGTCGFRTNYIFLSPPKDGNCNYINLIKSSKAAYITRGITDADPSSTTVFDISANCRSFLEKIYNIPQSSDIEELWTFIETGNFRTKKILECELKKHGHANFQLSKGSSQYRVSNGTKIAQLDTTKSKDAERITFHYPNGRIAVNDWDLGISTTLEPNKTNNGMRIRKIVGEEKIDLTSTVEDDIILLTDNLTGKQVSFSVDDIVQRDLISKEDEDYKLPLSQKKQAVIKLMKELSPTTILNILKFKNSTPKANFPFLNNNRDCQYSFDVIDKILTLTSNPHTVSHETLHAITDSLNLLNNQELINLHAKEAKHNKGIMRYLSEYATDGQGNDYERGLNELISIMGTFNDYGIEVSQRAETTRIAFPETTKAIEKKLMDYYQKTIQEVFNN